MLKSSIKKIVVAGLSCFTLYAHAESSDFYGVVGVKFSDLTPPSTSSMQTIGMDDKVSSQITIGKNINNTFALEFSFSNNSSVKVKDLSKNQTINVEYHYTTLGAIYKPFASEESDRISPFIESGIRIFDSNYEKFIVDEFGIYIGGGIDVKLFDDEKYKIRGSYLRYSEDSSSAYLGLVVGF